MPFFDPGCFDLDDQINGEIWKDSPDRQRGIQQPATVAEPGMFGAQQAMLTAGIVPHPNTVLPWVPDLVGKEWKDKGAVFVVGSAYAGFIREYSKRNATMCLRCYFTAETARQFQERFFQDVVAPDPDYYGKLAILFGHPPAAPPLLSGSQVCILDLCRSSFVRRGLRIGRRVNWDKSGDPVVKASTAGALPDIFQEYVDQNKDWTWQRFMESKSSKIVALGTIAEHGLLRLFQAEGFTITEEGFPDAVNRPAFPPNTAAWVHRYADQGKTLAYWLQHQSWWNVNGDVNGVPRTWKILPVYHPAWMNKDPLYTQTRALLATLLAAP